MKATGMEDNSEARPLAQIERHSYSEVGWISRQNLLASGRGRTFFLTSLFIELIEELSCTNQKTVSAVGIADFENGPVHRFSLSHQQLEFAIHGLHHGKQRDRSTFHRHFH